jgi:hypothetical protein
MSETKKEPATAEAFAYVLNSLKMCGGASRARHAERYLALLKRRMGATARALSPVFRVWRLSTGSPVEVGPTLMRELYVALADAPPVFTLDDVESLRHLGGLMSNLCFNLGQDTHPESKGLRPETRQQMRDLQRQWDAAVSALRRGGR